MKTSDKLRKVAIKVTASFSNTKNTIDETYIETLQGTDTQIKDYARLLFINEYAQKHKIMPPHFEFKSIIPAQKVCNITTRAEIIIQKDK